MLMKTPHQHKKSWQVQHLYLYDSEDFYEKNVPWPLGANAVACSDWTTSKRCIPMTSTPGPIHCEAMPFVVDTLPFEPIALPLDDTNAPLDDTNAPLDDTNAPLVFVPTPHTSKLLVSGFIFLTFLEGTANFLTFALGPTLPMPEMVLCVLCPCIGCFGTRNGQMMYMGIYMVYALHIFVWRLCELVWLTHAPLGHALADDTRVITTADAWTLQMLVFLVLVRGWLLVYTWWVIREVIVSRRHD